MTNYTYDEELISDLHKGARGYRPTEYFWEEWEAYENAPDLRQKMWDSLIEEMEEANQRQQEAEAIALANMKKRISDYIEMGAKTEVRAIKWIIEAEEFSDDDLAYGRGYFCYHFGLNYQADLPITEAINLLRAEVA